MSSKGKIVGGGLLGAFAIHVSMVACFGGGDPGVAKDGGILDAMVDAARDVVGLETGDAHAQDATSGTCDCPPGMPSGTVVAYAGSPMSIPAGWALCDGRAVPRTGPNAALFAAIGTAHGAGDMVGTLNLPDYRGRFLRGQDLGAMRDPDRAMRTAPNPGGGTGDAIGTVQGDELRSHTHQIPVRANAGNMVPDYPPPGNSLSGMVPTNPAGGAETRPINVSVNYIIKL